jgi:hypothetical protein
MFLTQIAIPFDEVLIKNQLTLPPLSDGGVNGYYQGIILSTGNLGGVLAATEWQKLDDYAAAFGVRTLVYYCWPDAKYGLVWKATLNASTTAVNTAFTTAAASVFPYLNRANPVPIKNATIYTTTTTAATGETTTPLLTVNGDPVAVLHTKPDNREYLATTFDNNPTLLHSMAFNYGLFNWVTKGVFLGGRKIYLSPQVDDLLIADGLYDPTTPGCVPTNPPQNQTVEPPTPCPSIRISSGDLTTIATWQSGLRFQSITKDFKVLHAFNGLGTTTAGGAAATNDGLVAAVRTYRSTFFWANHTYNHENLDCYAPVPNSNICTPADYYQSLSELDQNITVATSLRLVLDATGMVTPDISGLDNPDFMQAAYDRGIVYFPGDLSKMGVLPPVDLIFDSPLSPLLQVVPRRATNIFYNTRTSATGVPGSETDEYNYLYGPGGIFGTFFTTKQTYAQIVATESDNMLLYMLSYSVYPLMYHQSNLSRYSSSKSLMRDVIDATLTKYKAICTLPVSSLSMSDIAKFLVNKLNYSFYADAAVNPILVPGKSITLSMTTPIPVAVPITGACLGTPCATYGGQKVMQVQMNAPGTITITPTF